MDTQHLAQALAAFIDATVEAKIKKALANADAADLVSHKKVDVPARVACEACAAGEVEGARKVGRRWLATRSAWDRWIDRRATTPTTGAVVHLDIVRAAARRAAGGSK
jgi:hypothetical protein